MQGLNETILCPARSTLTTLDNGQGTLSGLSSPLQECRGRSVENGVKKVSILGSSMSAQACCYSLSNPRLGAETAQEPPCECVCWGESSRERWVLPTRSISLSVTIVTDPYDCRAIVCPFLASQQEES